MNGEKAQDGDQGEKIVRIFHHLICFTVTSPPLLNKRTESCLGSYRWAATAA